MRHDGLTKDLIDRIPGKQTDRKTPLGELNWIFTAITDTIAWNVLPRPLFQKLFRSVRRTRRAGEGGKAEREPGLPPGCWECGTEADGLRLRDSWHTHQ